MRVLKANARRIGELGHVRAFAKQALAFQPALGWFGYLLGYVFLSRHWDADKVRINRYAYMNPMFHPDFLPAVAIDSIELYRPRLKYTYNL